jgi:hypothetical protein
LKQWLLQSRSQAGYVIDDQIERERGLPKDADLHMLASLLLFCL